MLVDKRGIVRLVSLMVWLCTLAWIAKAQEAAQEEAPQEAIAGRTTGQPPEAAKPDWDEIDQRLVFLTVQLSTVESSIAATDKSLKKNGYLKIAKEEVAEQARLENDRDGGPVLWQEFYGLTVEKFYYHPEDGSTVRVKVGAVAARPPQIDYIYRANEANRLRAETDAAEIGSKIEDLLAYRKQLETEQSALWMKIAFRGVSSHELTTKPLYSLNLSAAGADELSKQALECARAGVAFVRSVDSELAAAQKGMDDPTATLDHLVQVTTTARTDLQAKLLAQPILSAVIRDPKMPLAKFSRAAKRIDDLAQNLSDAYRLAAECDEKDDLGGKRSYRGQVQQSAVDLATMLLSADQALTLATSEWNISSLAPNKPEVGPEMSSVDSIPGRLEAAKATHQSETKLARKTLVATIDVQMNAAADAGDLASVQALQSAKFKAAREGSIADDMTDQAVLAAKKATDQAVEAANVRLAAAYKQAIADYTKARKISEAVAVQDEFIALGLTSTSSTTGAINQPAESITGATGSLGDGVFSPPTILGGLLEVEIPAPIDEVVVGGSGRLLILHLKKLRQLAVFDVSQAKVLKYLPMPSSDIVYAAGSKKLFVGVKDLKRIQRWDLTKLELELTVATPEGGVGALACGAASLGPIVMTQLYLISRSGENPRRLTTSQAIDTEPVFAPDGRGIYFVSDRGGGPQVYRTTASGSNVERITFAGAYNISPAISPDGRTMAYISRVGGNAFRLHTLDLSTNAQPVALTDTSDDESPSFAPNGKLIIYASRAQGRDVLMTTTLDGKIKARLVSSTADVREPVWGPYGR